jgi:zinc protease
MKKSKFRKIILFTLILPLASCLLPLASYALEAKRSVLKNGLTLLIVERHNLPVVKVAVGINAGNLKEPEDKAGLASLTAGLLTEGTKNRTARQISEEIEFVGGSVGAGSGGDYVTVNLSVLKKDIDLGFELLSDIILNPSFPEDELNKKRKRIKGSLKSQEDNPGFVASREFKKAVFGSHPYGRLVTGTAETLDRITRDDLVNYHSTYYVPNYSIMAVVGDVMHEEVEALINKYFTSWKAKQFISPALPELEKQKKKKTITINRDLTQANVILGHIGVRRGNPDYYTLSVMNYILGGGGFASRLMQNIRDEKGLVYDIHSFFAADKFGGRFRIGLQTKNESANTAIEEILKEMSIIRNNPATDVELSDAKSFLTGSFPMRIETSSRIAGFLVAVEYYGLGVDYIDNYPGYINSVTKEEILRVAKKYLDPENFILVVVADQEKTNLREEFKQ